MSIAKVAEIAGVSNTTVSFVINGKSGISADTVERVRQAIRQTGYVPRGAGAKKTVQKEVRRLKTRNIGILMPEGVMSTVPFYARLFEAIHKELDNRELNMSPIRCLPDSYSSVYAANDLDGLILCNYIKEITEHVSLPFVSILGHPSIEDKLQADHIEPANDRIGAMAARYLIQKGHKNILAINPSETIHPAIMTRCQYFNDYANRNAITCESISVPYMDRDRYGRITDGGDSPNITKFISEYKSGKNRPTGIFVPCDSHMIVLLKSFTAAGIVPGFDVEFIGCNNEALIFDGLDPRPATIDINPKAMAQAAIVALLERINNPRQKDDVYKMICIEPTLVKAGGGVRETW